MALTWDPTEPMPADEVTIVQTVTINATSVELTKSRLEITSVPSGSAIEVGLVLDEDGEPTLSFTPDLPGAYGIEVHEYIDASRPVSFEGEPDSGARVLSLGASETSTVHVGYQLGFPLFANGHGLRLVFAVHNDTITAASFDSATTTLAEQAALDATVLAAADDCVGESSSTVGPALASVVGTLGSNLDSHFRQATVHPLTDSVNSWNESVPLDDTEAIAKLNKIRAVMLAHLLGASTAAIVWHTADDTKNVPISPAATTKASAIQLYADLARRCYERHRVQLAAPASHSNADAVNVLAAATKLETVVVSVLDFLAANSPTVPSGEGTGSLRLQSRYGLTKL